RYGDPGDVFALGNLSAATEVRLKFGKPGSSGLSGVLSVLNSAGAPVAMAAPGASDLDYTVPADQAGAYFARVHAGMASYGTATETALYFDGASTFVDLGAWSPGPQWTIEAWVRPVSLPGGRRTIAGGFAECLDWGITMQDGRFGIACRQPGGCTQTITAPDTVVLGGWYHVVGTCDGLTARLYVNGQFMASGAVESNYIGTKTGTRIGSEVCCGGNTFPGYIDEVAVWSRPLTGAEVQAGMAGPLSGTENGLAGYWPFNEGMGTTAADASGQGHPGTLQNGAAWTALAPASAGEPGLMAQYLLWIELRDQLSPSILSDTLPAEGTTVIGLVSGFALTFSEDMLAETINSAASYELRSNGVDGQFGTADDQLWPITTSPAYGSGLTANYRVLGAPLLPGAYRFTVTTAVRDRAGNPIPAPWTRHFVIGQIPGFSTELEPNNSAETATPLPMNSTQPDLVSGAGRGFLSDNNDSDFWSFEAMAGDKAILAAETPVNIQSSGLYYTLFDPTGAQLLTTTADQNGLFQSAPLVLPVDGLYKVRVTPWYGYYGEHRLRVSLYRNGLPVELEPNNSLATATPV
ncbi:MAG: LamG-like jellyroll fold domain-containing protein, partial [Verrucomicrobiia bacterium]